MPYMNRFVRGFLNGYRSVVNAIVAGAEGPSYENSIAIENGLDSLLLGGPAETLGANLGIFGGIGTLIKVACTKHKGQKSL